MFEKLKDLKTYEAGKPIELVVREFGIDPKDIIKLASNENPYGPSPKAIEKVKNIANQMYRYPDDSFFELKGALSEKFDIKNSNIIIGAGSDQILEFAIHAVSPKKVLMAGITFAMYEIYSKQVGAKILKTPSITHNLDEFYEIYNEHKPEIIFLCIPNNPLGECLDTKDVYEFLDEVDKNTLVVLDGAYQEFASYKDNAKAINPSEVIAKYSNVIYLGTFSKAYGLGGLRVGYGIAQDDIIQNLYKLRPPFNITILSLAGAIEALKDEEFIESCIRKNFEQMARYEEYAKQRGFEYIESYTNFITMYLGNFSSKEIAQKLLEKGVIIRDMTNYGFNAIRITIGTHKQNTQVFKILDEVLEDS